MTAIAFDALETIRSRRGLPAKIARELGISAASISHWKHVPAHRAKAVARITGMPLHVLRPDLWSAPVRMAQ